MASVREDIFAAIEAAITAAVAPGDEVKRMPTGDPSPSAARAVHIFDGGQTVEMGEAGTTRYALSVGIDGFVRGGDGSDAHAALNDLYAEVVRAIYADLTLRGITEEISDGALSVAAADRADQRRLVFSFDLIIHFATQRGDPAVIN